MTYYVTGSIVGYFSMEWAPQVTSTGPRSDQEEYDEFSGKYTHTVVTRDIMIVLIPYFQPEFWSLIPNVFEILIPDPKIFLKFWSLIPRFFEIVMPDSTIFEILIPDPMVVLRSLIPVLWSWSYVPRYDPDAQQWDILAQTTLGTPERLFVFFFSTTKSWMLKLTLKSSQPHKKSLLDES